MRGQHVTLKSSVLSLIFESAADAVHHGMHPTMHPVDPVQSVRFDWPELKLIICIRRST